MSTQQDTASAKQTKLISFIITAYNLPPDMLTQCIESVLALSLSPTEREIILIDDGSNPSPQPMLEKYLTRLIYIRIRKQGVSEARNTGLQIATGRYIQFIDGDDYLIPSAYGHCIDLMRSSDADLILFDHTRTVSHHTNVQDQVFETGCAYMLTHNIQGAVWGYAFRKEILQSLRFTKGVRYGEDEEFTPQLMLQAAKTVKTSVQAYFYRRHTQSALRLSDTNERLNDNLGVILRLQAIQQKEQGIAASALERRVAQLTMDYIYNVMTLLHSPHETEVHIKRLAKEGLFPLPARDYTLKYKWFQRLTLCRSVRRMLCTILPRQK